MAEVTILGLGNLLWADEGFGVRAAEKLFEQYADNEKVDVVDGGTQGLALLPWLQQFLITVLSRLPHVTPNLTASLLANWPLFRSHCGRNSYR